MSESRSTTTSRASMWVPGGRRMGKACSVGDRNGRMEGDDEAQREALEAIFPGRAGGTPLRQFPWAFKPSRLLEVRTARIELDHTPRRGWFRAGRDVEVRVADVVVDQEPVTCIIPGHHRQGAEVQVELQRSAAAPLDYTFTGRCGYEAS